MSEIIFQALFTHTKKHLTKMSGGQRSVSLHPTQIICKTKFQLCRRGNFICRGRKQTISQVTQQMQRTICPYNKTAVNTTTA